ncbi:septum formation initiator family protein [Streptomyces sp. NPDC127092]|uniref:FtsB family cell division protein n=1 Tax=Streptomyces sp. NPDC127092 TaxID=3347135 RepID=UPI0036682FD4
MTKQGPLKGRAARLGRLMPSGPSTAARTPFVLLVVLLLGGGLITLLLLNSALNQGSFKLSELKKETTELTDEEQALQRDVDDSAAPDALERRARELGMVPGGTPAFLDPDGRVRGEPSVAVSPKPLPRPTPSAGATAPAAGAPSGPAEQSRPPASPPPATGSTAADAYDGPGTPGTPGTAAPSATPTQTTATAPTTSGR